MSAWSGDGITDIEKLKPADFQMAPPADRMGHNAETTAAVVVKRLDLDYAIGEPFLMRDRNFNPVQWIVPVTSRTDPTKPPKATSLEYQTKFLKDQSWWFEKEKFSESSESDKQLLQHEKGHVWIREISTLVFNGIRQQVLDEVNAKIPRSVAVKESTLNLDSTPEDIAKAKALAKAAAEAIFVENRTTGAMQIGDRLAKTAASARKLSEDYDSETNSGTNTAEQLRWKAKILDMLTPKKKNETKEAKSDAHDSLQFDPANGQLLFTSDLIQSVPGLAFDTLVGAMVNFPVFHYEGQDSFHVPFFVALGDDRITIEKDGDVFFAGQLPYLFYTGGQLTGYLQPTGFEDFGSSFVEDLRIAFKSAQPFLMGMQVLPEVDLIALTDGFQIAGSTPFTNSIFEALVIPEPNSMGLLGVALAGLCVARRHARPLWPDSRV